MEASRSEAVYDAPRVAVGSGILTEYERSEWRSQNAPDHPTRRQVIMEVMASCEPKGSACRDGQRTNAGSRRQ